MCAGARASNNNIHKAGSDTRIARPTTLICEPIVSIAIYSYELCYIIMEQLRHCLVIPYRNLRSFLVCCPLLNFLFIYAQRTVL